MSWYNTYVLSALQKVNLFLKHKKIEGKQINLNKWNLVKGEKISDMNFYSRMLFDELKIAFTTTAGLVRRSDVYL